MKSISATLKAACLLLFWLAELPFEARAQTGNASLQGAVRDPSGAMVAGAGVTLEQTATGRQYKTKTTGAGLYAFPSIAPGDYSLSVEAPGMELFQAKFFLQTGQSAAIDAQLKLRGTSTEVTVSADALPLLVTTAPSLATVVERERIEQLPLNGRFFQNLIAQTTPGVEGAGNAPKVFGLRASTMEFTQDGASLIGRNVGQLTARPPGLDTINEFRVETSVSSAKYNRPSSTILSTKSGTNRVRGTLFHTGRNNGFGVARRRQDFYEKPPQLIRNEFGASIGGPLFLPKVYDGRNRTFFFAAWEEFMLRSGSTFGTTMPTPAMRNGDFGSLVNAAGQATTIYDPWSTGPAPTYRRTPYPANRIPANLKSPIAEYLWSVTPLPTLPDVNPMVSNNWFGVSPSNQDHRTTTLRFDHRVSDKDQIFVRYSKGNRVLEDRRTFNNNAPITLDRMANYQRTPVYNNNGVFSWTRLWSPTMFAETVVTGWHEDSSYNTEAPGLDTDWARKLKVPNPFNANGLPDFNNPGFNMVYAGPRPRKDTTRIWSAEQNYTKLMGSHQIEFGWRYRNEDMDVFPDQEQSQGAIDFGSNATALYDTASGAGSVLAVPRTGHNAANFFLGAASNYSANFNRGWFYIRGKESSSYVQDNWKVTPNLTINLGLRYEYFSPIREKNNMIAGFDFKSMSVVTGQPLDKMIELGYTTPSIVSEFQRIGVKFTTPEAAGLPPSLVNANWTDLSPRLGGAYKARLWQRSLVVRGGYGAYRTPLPLRTFNSRMRQNVPWTARTQRNFNAAAETPDGLPNLLLRSVPTVIAGVNSQDVLPQDRVAPFVPGNFIIAGFDTHQPTTTAHQWNLTLETDLGQDVVFRLGYVGTAGRNIDQWERLNEGPNNYVWFMNTGLPVPTGTYANSARRPLDQRTYGSIDRYGRDGYSNFNGITIEAQRRYKRGFAYQFFYTLSNALSTGNIDTGTVATASIPNPEVFLTGAVPVDRSARNRLINYSRDGDVPQHRLRWNFLVDLPFGKGKAVASNVQPWLNYLIGGWQVAGSGTWNSRWWQLPTANWGYLGDVEIYGKKYPVEDCRSGQCIRGYMWWNGYLPANRINSVDANGRPNGVMGVPAGYKPSNLPVWPIPADGGSPSDPNFALYETNNVFVTLKNGSVQRVAMDTSLHPWQSQFIPGPWNFNMNGSLFKVIPITERVSLRLNIDSFNTFNMPGMGVPGGNGLILLQSSTNGPRELQWTVRLTF